MKSAAWPREIHIQISRADVVFRGQVERTFVLLATLEFSIEAGGASDAALMAEIVRREQRALEELYDRYGRVLYSLALRVTQQPAVAEEIVQDVFLLVWKNAHRYESTRGLLQPWLFTMTRNRALDHLRLKREKQRRLEDEWQEATHPLPMASGEAHVDTRRRAEQVRALIGALPEKNRQAIELAFFEGMTHTEIAAKLQEPLGTVKSWIRGGLVRLRKGLKEAL
ncbi:MAG: sigma-70 family RNA polymerase sigma factor [Acidobacteria bacterium]|nr:sigma-70 family RNA polymerase sigma factor [Acidobacteriota bacterium]